MARPQGPSIRLPSESGPRWTSVSFIAASAAGSGAVAPSRLTRPHIPHMRAESREGGITRGSASAPAYRRFFLPFRLLFSFSQAFASTRDVIGEVAEGDVGVDQVEAPGGVGDRVQRRRACRPG